MAQAKPHAPSLKNNCLWSCNLFALLYGDAAQHTSAHAACFLELDTYCLGGGHRGCSWNVCLEVPLGLWTWASEAFVSWTPEVLVLLCALSHPTAAESQLNIKTKPWAAHTSLFFPSLETGFKSLHWRVSLEQNKVKRTLHVTSKWLTHFPLLGVKLSVNRIGLLVCAQKCFIRSRGVVLSVNGWNNNCGNFSLWKRVGVRDRWHQALEKLFSQRNLLERVCCEKL